MKGKVVQSESRRASKRRYARSAKGRKKQNDWRKNTVRGYLHRKYRDIIRRCNDTKFWHCRAGVECRFDSAKDFVNWSIDNCDIPNIPFEIHRKKTTKHYERGNIEFLSKANHLLKHAERKSYGKKKI